MLFFSSFLPIITIAYHQHLCLSPLPPSSYLFFNLTASHLPVLHSSLLSASLPSYIFTPSYLSVSPPSYIFIHLCPLNFLYSLPLYSLCVPIPSYIVNFSLPFHPPPFFLLSLCYLHPLLHLPSPHPQTSYLFIQPSLSLSIHPFLSSSYLSFPPFIRTTSALHPPPSVTSTLCILTSLNLPSYLFLTLVTPYFFKSLPFFILQSTKGYYKFNVSSGKTITNRSILAVPEEVLFNFCFPFLTFCTASSLYSLSTTGAGFLPFGGLKMVSTSPGMYGTNLVIQIRLFSAGFDQDFAVCFGSIFDPPYCFMTS